MNSHPAHPSTSEFCIVIPIALVRFLYAVAGGSRSGLDTHHAVLLSLPLPDLRSRPRTGDITHPLSSKQHRAGRDTLSFLYSPVPTLQTTLPLRLASAGCFGLPGWKTSTSSQFPWVHRALSAQPMPGCPVTEADFARDYSSCKF